MRKFTLLILCLLVFSVKAQVGIGVSSVDNSAILEISSTNQGILFPQISLMSTTDTTTITSPETGLVVYNINTLNDITPGYYYWNGTSWSEFMTSDIDERSLKCRNRESTDVNDNIDAPIFHITVWNDDGSLYEPNFDRVTIKEAGDYKFDVNIHFQGNQQMISPNVQLSINGTVVGVKAASGAQENTGGPDGSLVLNEILTLAANDVVRVRMSNGTSNSDDKEITKINGKGSSSVTITKIN